ncbi:MAG: CamS family sex pheromone protein [Bacilli bacterium]|nr:CamS family sex pheromone protein [Bacilli bacterium]
MRKYGWFILLLFFITGCSNEKTVDNQIDIEYSGDYYQIYEPYKASVGNNYVVNNVLSNYDKDVASESLMALSTNYFSVNNSLYQEGQYLSTTDLQELLSTEQLNDAATLTIDNIKITPTYVTTIYEQDYLASNGNLKGISLGIILNPYQAYQNSYGTYNYKTIAEEEVLSFGKEAAKKLIAYMRSKEGLSEVKILISLYLQPKPSSIDKGTFKAVTTTTNDALNFTTINCQYELITSDYVNTNDTALYTAFIVLEESLKDTFSKLYISGEVLYKNDTSQMICITVGSSSLNKSEILYITQNISENLLSNFTNEVSINIYIKSGSDLKALVTRERNTSKSNITIIGE